MSGVGRLAAAAAVVAVGLAIMGAAAQPASGTDQTEERNFAGPLSMCPGDEWDCVGPDDFPVTQVGTENVIVCIGDTAACATSSQDGDVNKIECIDEEKDVSVLTQSCGPFTQTGADAHNTALFKLVYDNDDGSTQCASQTGEIEQTGETNQFKADFRIVQRTTSGNTQTQEAHQVVEAEQVAEEKNESDVSEVQIQKATGEATTQLQNTGDGFGGECLQVPLDCSVPTAGPEEPYTCLNLEQELTGGSENISKLVQDVKQEAETKTEDSEQQQGRPLGGNDGRVHQSAPDDGNNVDVADQKTEQKLIAPGTDQSQFEDPQCCGVGSQEGGQDNEETINQTVKQEAGDDAVQEASATGVGFSPDGGCTINHDVENNGGSAQKSETSEPCDPFLAVNTTCTSSGEGGECESLSTKDEEDVVVCADGFVLEIVEGIPRCEEDSELE